MERVEIPIKQIDPHPKQRRKDFGDIEGLAASIKSRGILQAVILVKSGKRYITAAGHRRIRAATLAGLETVPADVVSNWDEAAQLECLMAENTQRKDMTTVEKAQGLQDMLDLGMDEAHVSMITGVPVAEFVHVKPVLKKAAKLTKDVSNIQPTLEEAAALVDYSGDKDAYEALLERVGTGQFAHELTRRNQERERAALVKSVTDKLKAEGVRITDTNYDPHKHRLTYIPIKAEDHAECPGHCAAVSHHGDITWYCDKYNLHNRESGGGGGQLSDAEKAARKAKREGKKLWLAAQEVRRTHVKGLCANLGTNVRAALTWIAPLAWKQGLNHGAQKEYGTAWEKRGAKLAAELLPAGPSAKHLEEQLFAQAAAMLECDIATWVDTTGGVDLKKAPEYFASYLAFLKSTGYSPADCEEGGKAAPANAPDKTPAPSSEDEEIEEID